MIPGPQSNGAWFVPLFPLRKDDVQFGTRRDGTTYRHRSGEYGKSRAAFLSYLQGWHAPLLRGNVELTVTFYRTDARSFDTDNACSALKDWLQGIAYVDDNQITDTHEYKRRGDVAGTLFKVTEVTE